MSTKLTTEEIKMMRHLVMVMPPIEVPHNGFRQQLVDIIDELIDRREQEEKALSAAELLTKCWCLELGWPNCPIHNPAIHKGVLIR